LQRRRRASTVASLDREALSAAGLDSLKSEITTKAEQLVDRLVAKRQFCAVAELAAALPVDIVASAVGYPRRAASGC
jgi:hypothetical protein